MWIDSSVSSDLVSDSEFDRSLEVSKILTEDYPKAKAAILKLEVYTGKRSERAVYELRDTFDHIASALNPETTPAAARGHLLECRTHLRRAMVEPIEYLAEAILIEIEALMKKKWRLDLLCLPFPDRHALDAQMRPIADAIVEGRRTKGSEESLTHMDRALELATALRDDLLKKAKPDKWHDRMFALRTLAVGVVVGGLFGLGLKIGYDRWLKPPQMKPAVEEAVMKPSPAASPAPAVGH